MRRFLSVLLVSVIASAALSPGSASSHYTKLTDVRLVMDDGVKLAADVYVPTVADGPDPDGLYPCVVEVTPYRKESRYAEGASYLPEKGIALIEVDARGTGGSEGEYDIVFSVKEQADSVAWVNWAATSATKDGAPLLPDGSNKLCESTVGMYGGSYSGIIQYLVASLPTTASGNLPAASPYLAAIAPQRAYGDLYRDIVYHGGQLIGSFGTIWSSGTSAYYLQPPTDSNTAVGRSAYADHLAKNDPMMVPYLNNPYEDAMFTSDDSSPAWTQKLYEDSSILPRISNLKVPALHLAGWFDSFTRGQLLTFQKAHEQEMANPAEHGPNFLVVGPWNHTGTHFITPDQGFKARLSDWYLYWLEGRAEGGSPAAWMDGPRVTYFQMTSGALNAQSAADGQFRTSTSWPPTNLSVKRLYLGSSGTLADGTSTEGSDSWAYNPTAGTAETLSRWDNAAGTPQPSWDQRTDSPKGLGYQTGPLTSALEVTGPIALRMFASTVGLELPGPPSAPGAAQLTPPYHDTDFVVKLSDVAPDGSARLVTQGYLRASHRRIDRSRSWSLGGEILGPYHLHNQASISPPRAGEVTEYLVELWPTAKTFRQGHRLRIDIYSSDTPNHLNLLKPALNTIFRGGAHDSYLALPVAP